MEIRIKDFDECKHRAQRIAAAPESAGDGLGMTIAWLTIIVDVIITAIQTHAL